MSETTSQERKSPFTSFYQMNAEHTKDLMRLANEQPKAHVVLYFLMQQMNNINAVVCSFRVLSEALDMSERTAKRAVKYLKDNGFIDIYKSGQTNIYAINKHVVWKSWGTNYKYAEFEATVLFAESEQKEFLKLDDVKTKRTPKELTI